MLFGFVGFTAIDVSLCGTLCSQSVLTLAAVEVVVEQIGVPIFAPGLEPKTALVTGAGASMTLCVKSIGCALSSAEATPAPMPTTSAAQATAICT
jgi:hypothetical protein